MKTKIWIWILAILLAAALVYIGVDIIQTKVQQKMRQAFQLGYQAGLNDTITALYQRTANCQVAVITLGNATRQVIDAACIERNIKT